jgi:hypothetical protein
MEDGGSLPVVMHQSISWILLLVLSTFFLVWFGGCLSVEVESAPPTSLSK